MQHGRLLFQQKSWSKIAFLNNQHKMRSFIIHVDWFEITFSNRKQLIGGPGNLDQKRIRVLEEAREQIAPYIKRQHNNENIRITAFTHIWDHILGVRSDPTSDSCQLVVELKPIYETVNNAGALTGPQGWWWRCKRRAGVKRWALSCGRPDGADFMDHRTSLRTLAKYQLDRTIQFPNTTITANFHSNTC